MTTPYTLDQIETFLAVVDEGSFSAAGRKLHRVQSAISYSIAQLEQALGTTLFDRSGRRPALTSNGERLVAEARRVMAQSRELSDVARRLAGGAEPELTLAVEAMYPPEVLARALAGLAERFPATNVRVITAVLGDVIDAITSGAADLGVADLAGGTASDPLDATHVGHVTLIPVCRPDHPMASVSPPQPTRVLEAHRQVVHTERITNTTDRGVLASHTWRVTDLEQKHALIRAGLGWGSLPSWMVTSALSTGELHRLRPEPWPDDGHRIALHAIRLRDRPLGPASSWLRDHLDVPRG